MPHPQRRSFRCDICNRLFLSFVGLFNHLKNHFIREHGEEMVQTILEEMVREFLPPETSDSDSESATEERETSSVEIEPIVETSESGNVEGTSSPEVIDITTTSSSDEMNEEVSAKPLQNYVCHLCRQCFTSQLSLEDHLKNSHDDGSSSSEMEVLDIASSSDEATAGASAKPLEHYFCHQCDYSHEPFTSQSSLEDHLKNSHAGGTSSSEMEVLDIASSSSDEATAGASAKPLEHYFCHLCDDPNPPFTSQSSLEDHLKTVHDTDKPLACIYCTAQFFAEGLLRNHEMQYHPNKTFHRCEACKKRFLTEIGLQSHKCVIEIS